VNSKNESSKTKPSFWQELQRRRVTRIAVAYISGG